MVIISVVLIAVALLAANSFGILRDIKRDADVQILDANEVVFNADFDVALSRAAGDATSFVATKREDALNQAGEDVAHAHLALEGLRNTTGDKSPIEGSEGKRPGFIPDQRMTSAVIERDLEVAQTLRTDTEISALRRLLDDVYSYAQNSNLLREDVSAHGKLETAANARGDG